jgi:hypothetical protein
MEITYTKPNIVEGNKYNYIVNAFITHNNKNNTYNYISINLGGYFIYDDIIAKLIAAKYTQDQVTAITLNYLLTLHQEVLEPEKVEEYQQEYKELQEYRAACKAEAKKAMEYAEINDIRP